MSGPELFELRMAASVDRWSARRGPYRLIYEIDEENRIVWVLHADHRADVHRPR